MAICMAEGGGLGQFGPLAIGMTLIMLVYSSGHISGSHFNPAVSLAVYLRGKLNGGDLLPYMVSQFLGATLAAMLSGFLLTSLEMTEPVKKELKIKPSLIAEVLGTMLYV